VGDVAAILATDRGKGRGIMAEIIAIANQKGGVGKTATAYNLGHALADLGRRVLLVDLDPQASLTMACGIEDAQGASMADVIGGADDGALGLGAVIRHLPGGPDLAPSDIALAGNELALVQRLGREHVLKQALGDLGAGYDFVLIDTPPNLGLLTVNTLTAADRLLIPSICDYLSLRGLLLFMDSLGVIKRRLNPGLGLLGVILTMYDARLLHSQDVLEAMEKRHIPVLPFRIGRSVRVAEALLDHRPIMDYDPGNPAAEAFGKLARWINAEAG